jgi:uncharacterized protein (DUF2141 family)
MKNFLVISALLICFSTAKAQDGKINLTVKNINSKEGGLINIAVYGKEGFLKTGKELKNTSIKVTGTEVRASFSDLPDGTYGIAVYHDENSDGKLNTNFIGIPKEPTGFSNDGVGKMGPPSFESVSFQVESGKTTDLTIHMK